MKELRICKEEHRYYKSGNCNTCPVCERKRKPSTGLYAGLSAPVMRVLENKNIRTAKQLSEFSEAEILQLHGIGPSSLPKLKAALVKENLDFKTISQMKNEVDVYIENFSEPVQKHLSLIRACIKKAAPDAEESFAYKMPSYKLNNKPLVYFAGYKNHIGLYATPNAHKAFEKELSKYKQGKGSVQFPVEEKLPLSLIKEMIQFKVKEINENKKA